MIWKPLVIHAWQLLMTSRELNSVFDGAHGETLLTADGAQNRMALVVHLPLTHSHREVPEVKSRQ
jgi:hypothetical protein